MVAPVAAAAGINPWVAGGAIIGGSIISGVLGNKSAKKAAAASMAGIAENRRQFDLVRKDTAPGRRVGEQSLYALQDMMGMENPYDEGSEEFDAWESRKKYDFEQSPGYKFRLGQGQRTLEASQSGRRLGGRAAKEAMRFGQDFASNEFGQEFGRMSTLAGYGPQAISQSAAAYPASAISQGYRDIGTSQMSGYDATNKAIQGGISNYLAYNEYAK